MKIDESNDAVPDTVCAGSQQNRREFLNGLGKWSMIVVAAVSFLRGSVTQSHAGREGTARPEWEPAETAFQRLARKKTPTPQPYHEFKHVESPHTDTYTKHGDAARTQPGGGQPSGQLPTKMQE
jgi:hypothetical protein